MDLLPVQVNGLYLCMEDVERPVPLKGADRNGDVVRARAAVGHGPEERGEEQVVVPVDDQHAGVRAASDPPVQLQRRCQAAKATAENQDAVGGGAVRRLSLTLVPPPFPAGRSEARRGPRRHYPGGGHLAHRNPQERRCRTARRRSRFTVPRSAWQPLLVARGAPVQSPVAHATPVQASSPYGGRVGPRC